MGATIITSEDLMEFKVGISPGTLQNLRINGTLPYTKIGGVLYYDQREIMEVLERNKVNKNF